MCFYYVLFIRLLGHLLLTVLTVKKQKVLYSFQHMVHCKKQVQIDAGAVFLHSPSSFFVVVDPDHVSV